MQWLKLLLIRHGESTSNRDRRMTGREDTALTPLGQQQCRQLAERLHHERWQPTHIYSSPLRRALESLACLLEPWHWHLSADIPTLLEPGAEARDRPLPLPLKSTQTVAKVPPPALSLSAHLQEFDAGILTGLTWSEAQQHYPTLCQTLVTHRDWVPIPDAETPLQGRQRASAFLAHLWQTHQNGDAVWILAHQWILEHCLACLLGSDRTWQIAMSNTALFEVWIDRDRWSQTNMNRYISDLWQIKRFNDAQHLTPNETVTS